MFTELSHPNPRERLPRKASLGLLLGTKLFRGQRRSFPGSFWFVLFILFSHRRCPSPEVREPPPATPLFRVHCSSSSECPGRFYKSPASVYAVAAILLKLGGYGIMGVSTILDPVTKYILFPGFSQPWFIQNPVLAWRLFRVQGAHAFSLALQAQSLDQVMIQNGPEGWTSHSKVSRLRTPGW